MTPLEEFQAKVKAGAIFEALAIAMSEAIELEITTSIALTTDRQSESAWDSSAQMQTRINLIEGKIENEISREFANNPAYAQLQKLHLDQVKHGRELIINNLASLQSMLAILNDTQSEIQQIAAESEAKLLPEE